MSTVGLVDRLDAPLKETEPRWHWQHPSVPEALADILLLVKGFFAVTDPRLWDHSVRVGKVSRTTAELLGLPTAQTDRLEAAGYLHCIGILGRLSPRATCVGVSPDAEMHGIIDQCQIGVQILSEVPRLVDLGLVILLSRRRWDGREMPPGPQGNAINREIVSWRSRCIGIDGFEIGDRANEQIPGLDGRGEGRQQAGSDQKGCLRERRRGDEAVGHRSVPFSTYI